MHFVLSIIIVINEWLIRCYKKRILTFRTDWTTFNFNVFRAYRNIFTWYFFHVSIKLHFNHRAIIHSQINLIYFLSRIVLVIHHNYRSYTLYWCLYILRINLLNIGLFLWLKYLFVNNNLVSFCSYNKKSWCSFTRILINFITLNWSKLHSDNFIISIELLFCFKTIFVFLKLWKYNLSTIKCNKQLFTWRYTVNNFIFYCMFFGSIFLSFDMSDFISNNLNKWLIFQFS